MSVYDLGMTLSPRQLAFARAYALSGCAAKAAREAGYSARTAKSQGARLLTKANLREAVRTSHREVEARLELSREQVLGELEGAVGLAKAQGNVGAMIAAWREIARICGYYMPETQSRLHQGIVPRRSVDELESIPLNELIRLDAESQ